VSDGGGTRVRVRCRGTVQGVGFRPAVHRLASSLGLGGWVTNDPQGATIEIEGQEAMVTAFVDRLQAELPPLARLDGVDAEPCAPCGEVAFTVRQSALGRREGALVPPDAVLCADCRREMETEGDRRYHYPFTTCTNCGPRFSLVRELPYDRERTSMACFPLCVACRREYEDPRDRRYHAEPVACPVCGPRLWLAGPKGEEVAVAADPVAHVRSELLAGWIVAVKGVGGFQLACRADSSEVVERLRTRKRRQGKPFAIMVRDLTAAHSLVELDEECERLLLSPRSPIVLAPRRRPSPIAEGVAPGLEDLGVMLPTTPLHVELLRDRRLPPLVMTSANLSEEPLCRTNREAVERLAGVADLYLMHDRDVVRRIDDSVVRSSSRGPVMVRRARGWVPEPLPLPVAAPVPVVATGGHLQVTACVAVGEQAFPSQHVGDLDSVAARAFLGEVTESLVAFLQAEPGLVAADEHPDYASGWLARELGERWGAEVLAVQHHLAHAAAVLAENGRFPGPGQRRFAVTLDGTGWGGDGAAWGGEWLEVDGDLGWRRLASLEPLPLVGGEAAVREPWRVAVAALDRSGDGDLIERTPLAGLVGSERLRQVLSLCKSGHWPLASGAGRVFEAAGALLGVALDNRWEGEAAVRLEALAASSPRPVQAWEEVRLGNEARVLPSSRLLSAAARRLAAGEPPSEVAAGFHATFTRLAADLTIGLGLPAGSAVALGGGCFVNRILTAGLSAALERAGFEILLARAVPPGDGGLSYGQAVVAAVAAARGVRPCREDPYTRSNDVVTPAEPRGEATTGEPRSAGMNGGDSRCA